jgi:5-methylcytosine-specific restriction endonuclease McrA
MTSLQLAMLGLFGAGMLFLVFAKHGNLARFRHVNSWDFLRSAEWRIARQYVFKACGRRCCNCGASGGLNIDHVLPRGRRHDLALDITNLQVLCGGCNKAKGGTRTDYRTAQQRAALAVAARDYRAFMIDYHKRRSG